MIQELEYYLRNFYIYVLWRHLCLLVPFVIYTCTFWGFQNRVK